MAQQEALGVIPHKATLEVEGVIAINYVGALEPDGTLAAAREVLHAGEAADLP